MAIKVERFGEASDGSQIDLYTLTNENGVSASFTNLGGTWVSMLVPDRNGEMADVVLGYGKAGQYLVNGPHLGAIIGRNANRIGGAACSFGNATYRLAENDNHNNLHSGPDYYHGRIWEVELGESDAGSKVTFSLFSPAGDQGYPGNAKITVSYTLTRDNSVVIDYHMVSDADTIANFTNHSYFNLAGHNSGRILDHQVWINGDYFTPADEYSIPYGTILPVKDTPMDFTVMKPIGRDIEADYDQLVKGKGYDHNWVLNHTSVSMGADGKYSVDYRKNGEVYLAARAYEPVSGRMMEVYTDLPGMQFYTANCLVEEGPGKEGAHYGFRDAFCFETQYFPDAVNREAFPSPVLRAGETYRTTTIYKFIRE